MSWGAADLVKFTEASYRQIDYWSRVGWLGPGGKPRGSGNDRTYTDRYLTIAALLVAAANAGLDLRRVATELNVLTELGPSVTLAMAANVTVILNVPTRRPFWHLTA